MVKRYFDDEPRAALRFQVKTATERLNAFAHPAETIAFLADAATTIVFDPEDRS